MAKLTRLTGKIFGETADGTLANPQIGQFGSAKAGTYVGTGDVATIQSLPAWSNGWIDAVTPSQQFPTLPEMTGVHKVLSYQSAYLLKEGVAEYDENTTYDINNICKVNNVLYLCTINNNNNIPTSLNGWIVYYDPAQCANIDLSNLSAQGEAKLNKPTPFSINRGSVDANGDGDCLKLPAGSSTIITKNFVRPDLTADGTMGGANFAVTASSAYNYAAWKAFDNSSSSYWGTSMQNSYTQSITFYNPVALNVTQLDMVVYGWTNSVSTYNDNINVYGSNDNSTWTQLASNVPSGQYSYYSTKNVTINLSSNTNSYKYYKIENTTCTYSSVYGIGWAIADVGITATYQETIISANNVILDGSSVPVSITNASGGNYVLTAVTSLDVSSGYSDGTYNVFAAIADGALSAYVNTIYRQKDEPSTPSTNDIWLDTSVRPLKSYIYDGLNWSEFTGVPVGSCVVSSGQVTSAKTSPYNVNGTDFVGCEYYQNGTEGYSTEWRYNQNTHTIMKYCEQWGFVAGNQGSSGTVALLKEYYDTNYCAMCSIRSHAYLMEVEPISGTTLGWWKSNAESGGNWSTSGYLAEGE